MEQLTFSQHVAANGGFLPWQDAVRLTLLTIQTISAQADPETTYVDVCPEQIVLSKDAREVLSCGKPHSLKEWDAADAANPQLLPWEFWNAWSARTPAAQVYPVAACLFGALSGHLPMAAKARLNGAALRPLTDIPDALNNVLQKGLALNAADRWPSLEAFRAALVDATKIEIAVDDTPEKDDDTPALQAGPLDLSKVRTVDAPKGPQAVYKPTAQKKSVKLGPLLPVAVLSVAFLGGLLAYQFTLRGTPTAEELFLPTATAKTSSSSKAAEPEREAASSAAESEAASSSEAAASSPAASEAPASAPSTKQEEPASSAASSKAASSAASSSKAASASSKKEEKPASLASSASSTASSEAAAPENVTQTLTLADGSKFVGKVDGSKQTGTLTKPNGDVYTGTFTDGKLEGKGTLKTASGNSYDGNFAGGQPSGSGTMKYANGSTYTGSWADGQRSGSGTVNYANGDQFSGSFAADLRDGSGTYTWANGTTYRGTWKAGEARKGGTYSYTDAGVKEGLSAGGNLTMQD